MRLLVPVSGGGSYDADAGDEGSMQEHMVERTEPECQPHARVLACDRLHGINIFRGSSRCPLPTTAVASIRGAVPTRRVYETAFACQIQSTRKRVCSARAEISLDASARYRPTVAGNSCHMGLCLTSPGEKISYELPPSNPLINYPENFSHSVCMQTEPRKTLFWF